MSMIAVRNPITKERFEFDPTDDTVVVAVAPNSALPTAGFGGWLAGWFVAVFFVDGHILIKVGDEIWRSEHVTVVVDSGLHIETNGSDSRLSLPVKNREDVKFSRAIGRAFRNPDGFKDIVFGLINPSEVN